MPRVPRRAIRIYIWWRRKPRRISAQQAGQPAPRLKGTVLRLARVGQDCASLRLGGLGAHQRTSQLLRRALAHWRVVEPARHVLVVHAASALNQLALGPKTVPVPQQKPECLERGILPQQTAHHDQDVLSAVGAYLAQGILVFAAEL